MPTKQPRIVAELGRPETPEEAFERKAANSRNYRDSKTVRNLLVALGASLAIVFALVLIVVRPDQAPPAPIDWHSIAQAAGPEYADPTLPEGWSANAAEPRVENGVQFWYIGFLTPSGEFLALEQHATPESTWVENHGDKSTLGQPGTVTTGTTQWTTYAHSGDSSDNYARIWESSGTTQQMLLYGTATEAEFTTLATALQEWTR